MKRTTKSIQAEIAKGAFRPHTALSTMALAYYQQETTSFAKNMFPVCPVQLFTIGADSFLRERDQLLRVQQPPQMLPRLESTSLDTHQGPARRGPLASSSS